MNRDQVLDTCYTANTLLEVEAAWQVRAQWLKDHPDDISVLDVGEMLSMLEDAIKITGENYEHAPMLQRGKATAKAS